MARIKRYDLYEGDGEVIGEEESWPRSSPLPGRQPKGRAGELRERDRAARQAREGESRERDRSTDGEYRERNRAV